MSDYSICTKEERGRYYSHFTEDEPKVHIGQVTYMRLQIMEVVERTWIQLYHY